MYASGLRTCLLRIRILILLLILILILLLLLLIILLILCKFIYGFIGSVDTIQQLHRPERKMRQNKYIKKEYKDILS